MKNFLCMLLMFGCMSVALAQKQKVAVYVTAPQSVKMETQKIVGSELVAAIALNDRYTAVERTEDFLQELQKEQGYQRAGNVDNNQISKLGKQFGVNLVCVADITPFDASFYIQARFIDVENATVISTARVTSELKGIDGVVKTAEDLALKLIRANMSATTAGAAAPAVPQKHTSYIEFKSMKHKDKKVLLDGNHAATAAYKKYRQIKISGAIMLPLGVGMTTFAALFSFGSGGVYRDGHVRGMYYYHNALNFTLIGVGSAATLTGIILLSTNNLKKTYSLYTDSGRKISFTPTPFISPTFTGIGLTMKF